MKAPKPITKESDYLTSDAAELSVGDIVVVKRPGGHATVTKVTESNEDGIDLALKPICERVEH